MSSTPSPVPHDQLRASDADRQLVADVLTSAFADGRITRSELDERLAATWSARTFGDLTPITEDLTGAATTTQYSSTGLAEMPGRRRVVPVQPDIPATTSHVAILGSRQPEAGAPVAARSLVTSVLGDVKLDLRGSTFAARQCHISLQNVLGSVKILVPAGVTVRDRTVAVLGESSVKGTSPAPDGVVLEVSGVVLLGSVSIEGPGQAA